MAQLKDTVVSGSLRATDSLLTTTLQTKILNIPTTSNGTTYGPGTSGNVVSSNGTSIYWRGVTDNSSSTAVTSSDTNLITGRTLYYAGYVKSSGVTSVQVQASSPLQSSTNTAQNSTLSTTISFINQNANLVLAGPSSGTAAAPSFRSLVAADLPNATTSAKGGVIVGTGLGVSSGTVSVTYGTAAGAALASSGSAGSANSASRSDHTHPFPALSSCTGTISIIDKTTGTLGVARGGTGTNTEPTQGGVIYGSSTTAYGCTAAGTSGQFLKSAGTGAPTWSSLPTGNANTAGIVTLGAAGGAATYGHTHSASIAKVTSGTSSATLEYSAMYKITAGGDNFIFTMPAAGSSSSGVSSIKITTSTPLSGGSSTAKTGAATYSLSIDTSGTWSGGANYLNMNDAAPVVNQAKLEFFYLYGNQGTGWANKNPTASSWYHHIRMNHASGSTTTSSRYFVDIACCFDSNNNYIRRMYGGTDGGWKRLWTEGNSVTGAVWNDYAEYRTSKCEEPGYCVFENGDDTLSKTTTRLQHFAGITSDTWGFAQGKTENAKTPIAVSGRVLAYTYKNRNEYKPGDCVCAAPNGTIDIMTRDEIMLYPDKIVGTVSCVPEYEEWGGGEDADRPPVKVNNRIWIKVK